MSADNVYGIFNQTMVNISDFQYRCTQINYCDVAQNDLQNGYYLLSIAFIIIIIFFDLKPNKYLKWIYAKVRK